MASMIGRKATNALQWTARAISTGWAAKGVALGGAFFLGRKVVASAYGTAEQSGLINPILMGRQSQQGYGKRGLDGSNNNTDGLVQSLYRGRRAKR